MNSFDKTSKNNIRGGGIDITTNKALNQQLDPALLRQALALIHSAQRIAVIAHEHPDGDCLGSALGLAHILGQVGKTCVIACADPAPGNLAFMPGIDKLQHTLDNEDYDLVIALDAGELSRFGSLYQQHQAFLERVPILNIDHHLSSSGCGNVNIIDPISAATAELLVLFQQQAKLPLNKDAALCLLTGIITDTSSFQFTNTTARTLEASAVLLRAGAVPETVVQPIYRTRPLAQMRFQSLVISNAQTSCNGRLIWSQATDATLAVAGATPDMDDNFSGLLRDIEGVEVAVFFKSYGDPNITRLSMRSAAPYNAAEICQRIANGGGHARAAGGTLHLPIDAAIKLVTAELERIMCT
ncbi:MAG: bifunctional oligoribonuclease/PAP phosphatase NrnA [Chloroflexi bacterium]|nr:MAG: bifunctional oligoribonuclease/PAP phosphatase NrnA [Chloroflexota bacterium]